MRTDICKDCGFPGHSSFVYSNKKLSENNSERTFSNVVDPHDIREEKTPEGLPRPRQITNFDRTNKIYSSIPFLVDGINWHNQNCSDHECHKDCPISNSFNKVLKYIKTTPWSTANTDYLKHDEDVGEIDPERSRFTLFHEILSSLNYERGNMGASLAHPDVKPVAPIPYFQTKRVRTTSPICPNCGEEIKDDEPSFKIEKIMQAGTPVISSRSDTPERDKYRTLKHLFGRAYSTKAVKEGVDLLSGPSKERFQELYKKVQKAAQVNWGTTPQPAPPGNLPDLDPIGPTEMRLTSVVRMPMHARCLPESINMRHCPALGRTQKWAVGNGGQESWITTGFGGGEKFRRSLDEPLPERLDQQGEPVHEHAPRDVLLGPPEPQDRAQELINLLTKKPETKESSLTFKERYIYDQLNVREAGVLEFAGPCSGSNCRTCTHINEKISELTQSSKTKQPTKSNLSKAKQLRSLKKKHRGARTANNLRTCPFCDGFHPITASEYKDGDEFRRGLPRTSMEVEDGVSKRVIDENWPAKGMTHKRVPLPFGDVPGESGPELSRGGLNDNPEGKDACRWCGGFITDPDETVTKWKENSELFHPGCLRSLRTFCSGARRAPEDTFESGLYSELRKNAEEGTGLS